MDDMMIQYDDMIYYAIVMDDGWYDGHQPKYES